MRLHTHCTKIGKTEVPIMDQDQMEIRSFGIALEIFRKRANWTQQI